MKSGDDRRLDNPVWFALSESHKDLAVDLIDMKFYPPDYCPFGGFQKAIQNASHLDQYARLADRFFVVGERPELSDNVEVKKELVCLQMTINHKIQLKIQEGIVTLDDGHYRAINELVNLVQPGYFQSKTASLGSYFGIFKEGELVAVTGERMSMYDFVEVSAVCTHPNFTRMGYAKQLVAHTANNIYAQKKVPFLHVVETNAAAIELYSSLGFETRRKISFWNIQTKYQKPDQKGHSQENGMP